MKWVIRVGLVALPVLIGLAVWFVFLRPAGDLSGAAVGDCAQGEPYRPVGCSEPGAAYKVLAVLKDAGASCADVAGASSSVRAGDRRICLGGRYVDPSKAVNAAREGECVDLDPAEPQRVGCDSADADHRVLRRLTDVPSGSTDAACQSVAGADKSFTWDVTGDGSSVAVVLCLGPLRS